MNLFVVSTECPTCGAPLDFAEGTNAVTCGHCRSNLLVTGRKQVLSYYVGPKLDERRAVALAVMTQRNKGLSEFRATEGRLYFIPYYRMTGQDFGWEEPPPQPQKADEAEQSGDVAGGDNEGWGWLMEEPSTFGSSGLLSAVGEVLEGLFDETVHKKGEDEPLPFPVRSEKKEQDAPIDRPLTMGPPARPGQIVLNDRYIEKNFLACNLSGVGLYSLGIRPAVLRLELFRKEAVTTLGRTVMPSMGPEEAEEVGVKTALNPALLYRRVIGRVLSIVYFPFWVVRMESQGKTIVTILDAVSQAVINADAPLSISGILDHELETTPEVIGFRPLTCPNCGWDLPVRPDDCIFVCKDCGRVWKISGNALSEVTHEIADVPAENQGEARYLPFWVLRTRNEDGEACRFFIPAFRYRRLKFLVDMALKISRLQPSYGLLEKETPELNGCYYDSDDAGVLAQFTQAGMAAGDVKALRCCNKDSLPITDAKLTWFPFSVKGEYLIAPFGGMSIPKNLLL